MEKKFDISDYKTGMKLKCLESYCDFYKGEIYKVIEVDSEGIWVEDSTKAYIPFYDTFDNLADCFEIIVEETRKEEKTTMENKLVEKEILRLGKKRLLEEIIDRVYLKQASDIIKFNETSFEEWSRGILMTSCIPKAISYDSIIEYYKDDLMIFYNRGVKEANDKDDKEIEDREEKELQARMKEARKQAYLKLKKEFGKKENK